ncbi:type II toxin-antitoxin system VapC family toxin [bacterium]|nr:type II toxin-antitoxin system VapC family toxin [bacterium]
MTSIVLDTSVAVAWFLPEVFSSEAREWRNKMMKKEVEFYVPNLHFYEFGNVLRKYVLFRDISQEIAQEIFSLHLESPLKIISPNKSELLKTSLKYNSTIYDAVYISVALDLQAPLLTAERSTREWVTKLGKLAITLK